MDDLTTPKISLRQLHRLQGTVHHDVLANVLVNIAPRPLPLSSRHARTAERWMSLGPLLSVRRQPTAPPNRCYWNVQRHCMDHGGIAVLGWWIGIEPDFYLIANHHCVWQAPDGELLDITIPENKGDTKSRTTFLPDPAPLSRVRETELCRPHLPRHLAIGKGPLVARAINNQIQAASRRQASLLVPIAPQFPYLATGGENG